MDFTYRLTHDMNTEKITALEKRWTELLKGPKKSDQTEIGRTKITAAELQHQLLQNEDYQKWLREKERVRIALEEAYVEDEKPLVEDLRQVGVDVKSVWNLVNTKSSYKSAIPVLLAHLPMQYHLKNKEGIIRALAVKEARGIACRPFLKNITKLQNTTLIIGGFWAIPWLSLLLRIILKM